MSRGILAMPYGPRFRASHRTPTGFGLTASIAIALTGCASRPPAVADCKAPDGKQYVATQTLCHWSVQDAQGYELSEPEKQKLRCKIRDQSRVRNCIGIG